MVIFPYHKGLGLGAICAHRPSCTSPSLQWNLGYHANGSSSEKAGEITFAKTGIARKADQERNPPASEPAHKRSWSSSEGSCVTRLSKKRGHYRGALRRMATIFSARGRLASKWSRSAMPFRYVLARQPSVCAMGTQISPRVRSARNS